MWLARMIRRVAVIGAGTALLVLAGSAPVGAHYIGNDSVDGRKIAWEDYTRYDDQRQWGIDQWNALGKVSIKRDGLLTITDLEYGDYTDSTTASVAYWQPRLLADLVNFNTYHMDRLSLFDARGVGTHELGHGLGIDHSFNTEVMYAFCCNGVNTPQSHDRADYMYLWG